MQYIGAVPDLKDAGGRIRSKGELMTSTVLVLDAASRVDEQNGFFQGVRQISRSSDPHADCCYYGPA